MTKYVFGINGKRTIVYSEDIYVGGKFDHQRVYTHGEHNLSTFNEGDSIKNVYRFVQELDPGYQRETISYLIFPALVTSDGKFTLDGKKKISSGVYQKQIYDNDDLSIEEFHYIVDKYNEMRKLLTTFVSEFERKRIIN